VASKSKLKDYLKDNGISIKWFAEKLGMSPQMLYKIVDARASVPKKYWKKIIVLTGGKITLRDILEIGGKEFQGLEYNVSTNPEDPLSCELSLK